MIPHEKQQAVMRGLSEAFGGPEYEGIAPVLGGHTSSLVFRIIVRGTPYLLKIIMRTDDPARHYKSMTAAAEDGLAPRVWYASREDRISITDFVEARPLSIREALIGLPRILRRLHALPSFGRAPFNTSCTFLMNQSPALDGFLQKFRAANLLPESVTDEFFARYTEVTSVYPYDDGELVSSHNDLFKPDNILFDGTQVLLVDWEAAFLNDRYADLAVVANQVVGGDEDEAVYLREYFGTEPGEYRRARFHLMQQIAHMFYTMAFLLPGWTDKSADRRPTDWNVPVPKFEDYYRRMWAGKVDLADKDVRVVFGRIHCERLLRNVRLARYRDSLEIVRARNPNKRGCLSDIDAH